MSSAAAATAATSKKSKGQFYTVNNEYILQGFPTPSLSSNVHCILEPFAGKGDLLDWLLSKNTVLLPIEAYDIDPKRSDIMKRDTLTTPPNYSAAWVLTNPPYLARNKSTNKALFDKYNTNDLYKCFITSLCEASPRAKGGIIIIPAGFFFSPRDVDVRCRAAFLSQYRLKAVRYFEETVFPDTPTTVVAIAFEDSGVEGPLTSQTVEWTRLPSSEKKMFTLSEANDWIIGGDIYKLTGPTGVNISRHVSGVALKTGVSITGITLCALDSGTAEGGRICLEYKPGYVYPAKDTSRTYATLCVKGLSVPLTEPEQQTITDKFNDFIEKRRSETWSLFLPQYRESKEYARKRIPFELAYTIVEYLIGEVRAVNDLSAAFGNASL